MVFYGLDHHSTDWLLTLNHHYSGNCRWSSRLFSWEATVGTLQAEVWTCLDKRGRTLQSRALSRIHKTVEEIRSILEQDESQYRWLQEYHCHHNLRLWKSKQAPRRWSFRYISVGPRPPRSISKQLRQPAGEVQEINQAGEIPNEHWPGWQILEKEGISLVKYFNQCWRLPIKFPLHPQARRYIFFIIFITRRRHLSAKTSKSVNF